MKSAIKQSPREAAFRRKGAALITFLTLVLENGWDAYVIPARGTAPIDLRLQVSHDEWLKVHSAVPIEIGEVDFEIPRPTP